MAQAGLSLQQFVYRLLQWHLWDVQLGFQQLKYICRHYAEYYNTAWFKDHKNLSAEIEFKGQFQFIKTRKPNKPW